MTVITFLPPDELLSLNDRRHRMTTARIGKAWREQAWAHAMEQVPPPRYMGPSVVDVELPVTTRRRADSSNLFLTVKYIVDGFTDAGCWPDDDDRFVYVGSPRRVVGAELVVVTITPWRQELVA